MQNTVPPLAVGVERALADRAVAGRRDQYASEVRRLIDAALVVMRRTGGTDPPVRAVVRHAGLSNQAFYRHFPSKDALLVAVLADGRRRLVSYLGRRVATAGDPAGQVRRWVEGVMEQARNADAAAATRPFVANAGRLAASHPDEVARSRAELVATLRPAVEALGGDAADAELVHDLTMRRMEDALLHGRRPDRAEVERLVAFCLAAVGRGT